MKRDGRAFIHRIWIKLCKRAVNTLEILLVFINALGKIVDHYLNFFDSELAIRIHPYLHQAFFKAFSYGYPGNVRELVSVAERITALAEPERLNEGGYLSGLVSECLDIQATKEVCPNIPLLISGSYREDVRNAEYAILTHYCSANNCTMSELAKKLGISRATLYNRLRVQGKSEIT